MNRALTLTDADHLTLLSLIANRRHLCTTELNNPHYADDHAEIRAEFDDLGRLYRVVALAAMLPESSTAPAPSVAAGSFDGTAGAAGGAE